jgi:5,10-methylenetetrahydromethanopterin reductase
MKESQMPVGLSYAGTYPLSEFLTVATVAEEVGIDSIWLTEEYLYRDPMILAAKLLACTNTVKVIPGPISPFFKHPVAIARETLSLAEMAEGRLALQLGVGDLNGLRLMGIEVSYPYTAMVESINTVKALLNGEFLTTSNGIWNMTNTKMVLGGKYKIPLFLAAMGPKMLKLAYQVADGTILSHMMSVKYIQKSIDMVKSISQTGATNGHEFYQFLAVSLASSRKEAFDQIRPDVAHWLGVPYPQPVHVEDWNISDLDIDHMVIYRALQNHDIKTACNLISDKVLETLSISGTSKDFEYRIREYLDAGVSYPVIGPIGDLDTKIKTIKLAAKIFGNST